MKRTRLSVWLQLVRLPNLFSVPGDPLAGYLAANQGWVEWPLLLVVLGSLCVYAGGLLMNDYYDAAEDLADRPDRPVPSGAVSRSGVGWAAVGLNGLGLGAYAATGQERVLMVGVVLAAMVWLYNSWAKRVAGLGAFTMGACRALSTLAGAVCGPIGTWQMAFPAVLTTGLFIAAVTHLARFETLREIPRVARHLPFFALLPGCLFGVVNASYAPAKYPAVVLFGYVLFVALRIQVRLLPREAPPIPPLIGAHIRLLIPLQAAVCWFGDPQGEGRWIALGLLGMMPLARVVGRWFYAS
jgi:4-hydroxybenzoate polyprenyltransferase